MHMSATANGAIASRSMMKASSTTSLDTELSNGMSDDIASFFLRNGFSIETREICDSFARARFSHAIIEPIPTQGYCSYTLSIGSSQVLQFRPGAFGLGNLKIIPAGRRILGDLVPYTNALGVVRGLRSGGRNDTGSDELHVYLLNAVPGITLSEMQEVSALDDRRLYRVKRRLMQDLGIVFAKTYITGKTPESGGGLFHKGRVGSSLRWRLQLLQSIASPDIRVVVDQVQQSLEDLKGLRWCLTHGDLVPANIMVDPSSGRLCGLIDWAEGEYLPFGVGLYGLEEVLGTSYKGRFEYHPYHQALRDAFWKSFQRTLRRQGLKLDELELERIMMARKLGILLWRGIAFEDGRLNRVVEASRDDSELHKLHLFLSVKRPISLRPASGLSGRLPDLFDLRRVWRLLKACYAGGSRS